MANANAIDRMADYLSPRWGLSRARARLMVEYLRDYDAASKGRRTDSWRAKNTSANTETAKGLAMVRDRHREMRRNNPWVERAITVIKSQTVKYGITGEIKHPDDQRRETLNGFWKRWAEATICDADGLLDLAGLQGVMMSGVAEGGDILIRRRRRRGADGLEVPLQLQVLEGDYLDHTRTDHLTNGRIVQGVEIDPIGRRRSYHMYRDHPGDLLGSRFDTVPVPASEVAHVYQVERPGQMRGMPWGRSAYITIRDLDGFDDAYLLRQKLANCIMAFVYDHAPSIGGATEPAKLPLPETLEPGLVAGLPAGKEVKFSDPPAGDHYGPFTDHNKYKIAIAYGISYEALTGDMSKVNFTSGRMGKQIMMANVEQWRWHMLIPMGLDQIATWFFEALDLIGVSTEGASMVWTPPRDEMLNPAQEVPAMRDAVRSGLTSLPEAHRELGFHSDKVLEEIAQSNKDIDRLALTLDSDPRKTSAAGLSQQNAGKAGNPQEE